MPFPYELPPFCLERWQSERETTAKILLSESGVEPLTLSELKGIGAEIDFDSVDLGYGWTRGDPRLRKRIAEYYGDINEDNVLITNGTAEANLLVVAGLIKPGDIVIVDMPNYKQVYGLLQARSAEVYEAWRSPKNGWHLPVDELIDQMRKMKPRAIFLTNPNNPTGAVERDSLKALAEEAEKVHSLIIVDEVYRGLEITGETPPSILELARKYNIIAVSTGGLSKVYGLPGLRIGWIASNVEGIIERAWAVKDYTSISPSRLSEAVAIAVFEPSVRRRLEERARGIVKANLEVFKQVLEDHRGVLEPWWPEAGAFLLARVPWTKDTWELAQSIYAEEGILVNPGECFDLPGTIRIGIGHASQEYSRMAYTKLMEALRNIGIGKKA